MTKIIKTKKQTIKPIKPFTSIDEEADFWDTHSVVDEINDGALVGFHQVNKTKTITIRIDPKNLQILRNKAFKKGLGPTTLARMWILEHLTQAA